MNRQKPKPAAFMSYAHLDDKYGHVTRFYERLSHEVGVYIGEEFLIFRDREEILLGQSWEERIEESLDEVTFLIPIITPRFFSSEVCRDELERFLEREKKLGRNDLILPVYYIDCPLMNDEEKRADDNLAQAIATRQYVDWRELRHEPFTSPQVGKTLAQLAVQIRDALERVQVPEKGRAQESVAYTTRRQVDDAPIPPPPDIESAIFARELSDTTVALERDLDDVYVPLYVLTPTGAKINRVFVVGTLTEKEDLGTDTEYWRARISDPTGAFFMYAGQDRQDAMWTLVGASVPEFLAVVGKVGMYTTEGGRVITSIFPETISVVDALVRDRWVLETARQTLDRIRKLEDGSSENLSMVDEHYSMDLKQYKQMVASALESMR